MRMKDGVAVGGKVAWAAREGRLILDRDSFVIRYFLCGSRVSLFLGDIVSSGPETRDGPD